MDEDVVEVRPGHKLDSESLRTYLQGKVEGIQGDLSIYQFKYMICRNRTTHAWHHVLLTGMGSQTPPISLRRPAGSRTC